MERGLNPITLTKVEIKVYRAPIVQPVRTAFGIMSNRPAVIVEAVDQDGTVGYGEIWSNFPQCGAEHRARLALDMAVPLIIIKSWPSPEAVFDFLSAKLHILALQTGEPGPIAQVIAGIDTALWDLAARREDVPLWQLLEAKGHGRVPTYASGINPDGTLDQAKAAAAKGYRAFKLKIGFGQERDLSNLQSLRDHLGSDVQIMVDANQAFNLNEAIEMSALMAPYHPLWLEEPLPADSPIDDWKRLAETSSIPLAGGENLRGDCAFDDVIEAGIFAVIQPDLAKWGGISKGYQLAKRIHQGGARYCPHYLGGGIGLLASAHLLAAAGGDGLLEIDCNLNPLREGLAKPYPPLIDGDLQLSDAPGLGVAPDPLMDCYALPILA